MPPDSTVDTTGRIRSVITAQIAAPFRVGDMNLGYLSEKYPAATISYGGKVPRWAYPAMISVLCLYYMFAIRQMWGIVPLPGMVRNGLSASGDYHAVLYSDWLGVYLPAAGAPVRQQ